MVYLNEIFNIDSQNITEVWKQRRKYLSVKNILHFSIWKIPLTLSIEWLKLNDSQVEKNIYIFTYHLKSFESRHHNAGYYVSAVLFQTVELFQIHEQDVCNVHCSLLRNYHFLDYVRIARYCNEAYLIKPLKSNHLCHFHMISEFYT